MALVYTLNDVSGQVDWVEESFLTHPKFGPHLIVVPYGTKPYNPEMYSGNADRLRAKLAKDQADAEAAAAQAQVDAEAAAVKGREDAEAAATQAAADAQAALDAAAQVPTEDPDKPEADPDVTPTDESGDTK